MFASKILFCVFICVCFLKFLLATNNSTNEEFLPKAERIVRGEDCNIKDSPYIVSIKATYWMIHSCGGSLIDGLHVLTAAHCYEKKYNYYVVAGQSNFMIFDDEDIQMALVVKVFVYPDYDKRTHVNDIAVFKLMFPFVETNYTRFVKLPPPRSTSPCKVLDIAGWGQLTEQPKKFPIHLQCVKIPICSKDECKKAYNHERYDLSSAICTLDKSGEQGVCFGDSGGPLMCQDTQRALVSWGGRCVGAKYPTVHTDVSLFIDFIKNSVAIGSPCLKINLHILYILLASYVLICLMLYGK